jgi:hypothetical protein
MRDASTAPVLVSRVGADSALGLICKVSGNPLRLIHGLRLGFNVHYEWIFSVTHTSVRTPIEKHAVVQWQQLNGLAQESSKLASLDKHQWVVESK